MTDTALAVREYDATDLAPRFVVSLDDMAAQVKEFEEFKRRIMRPTVDYGNIPNTDKPTLLKPGAEKLCMVYGYAPTFETVNSIEDWDKGLFHYEERCVLTSKRTGQVIASANGSANSKEPRYRWRNAQRLCPSCHQPAIIKGKEEYGGGYVCFRNKGGCNAKFRDNDPTITGQQVGKVENTDIFELVNTLKKMAQKRALVAVTLIATGTSGTFTQDVEDLGGHGDVIEAEARVVESQPAQQPQRQAQQPSRVIVQEQPRPAPQPRAAAPTQATSTKCSKCPTMVESESLLNACRKSELEPLCSRHFNARSSQPDNEGEPDGDAPF